MMNYYEILDIDKSATKEVIKKAYLKLANIYHPDKARGDSDAFKLILEAYDVLYDEEKRKHYDETGTVKPESDEREKINKQLASLLLEVVDSSPDSNYLDEMRLAIELKNVQMARMIEQGQLFVVKRQKALTRVVRKDGKDNLFAAAIQSDIDNIESSIQNGLKQIGFNSKLLEELNLYMMVSNELTNIPSVILSA